MPAHRDLVLCSCSAHVISRCYHLLLQHEWYVCHLNALKPAQVSPDASADELKRAFRKRAKESHPDVAKCNANSRRHHFRAVLNAYKGCPTSTLIMAVSRSLTAMPDGAPSAHRCSATHSSGSCMTLQGTT